MSKDLKTIGFAIAIGIAVIGASVLSDLLNQITI